MANETKHIDQEVVTLGKIYTMLKGYVVYVAKRWWIILILALLAGAYRFYQVYTTKAEYTADLSFTLYEEEGGGGMPSVNSLMGQFGLSSMDNVDFDRILDFLTTRKIVSNALFRKVKIKGYEDYFANHYLREFEMHQAWEERGSESLIDFWFTHDDVENFTVLENIALNNLWRRIKRTHFTADVRGSGIMDITFKGESQQFAVEFLNTLYDELSTFYVYKLRERSEGDLVMLQERMDSVKVELGIAEIRYAKFRDTHKNLVSSVALVEEVRLKRSIEILNGMYIEIVRNLEILRFRLKTNRPYLVPIDRPVYPLSPKGDDPIMSSLFWFIGVSLLLSLLFAGIKFVRDIIDEEQRRIKREEEKIGLKNTSG